VTFRALVADTETTGAEAADRPCEVAWLEIDENLEIIDERHSRIDPERPISAGASGIHGITDDDVADAPTMTEYFSEILGPTFFAPDDEVLLIAHNVAFDRRMLKDYMPITEELCTLRLARRTWPEAENHKLATLMFLLKLKRAKSHSAHGDVLTCYDLLCKIVERSGKNLQELINDAVQPIFVPKMTFGAHKGKPLAKVPSSYVTWLLGKDNVDKDLRWSFEQLRAGRA
jgi:exodeoxyribonuclease X